MARRCAHDGRSPGDPDGRAAARPRRGDLHRRPAPERDAAHGRAALASRCGFGRPHRPGAGARAAGRARGGRARRDPAARRRLQLPGRRPSRPSAPTRTRRRAPRSRRSTSNGTSASRCSIRTRPCGASRSSTTSPACASAATTSRASPQADVVVSGEFRTAVVLHNSMETHQAVVQWVGDSVEVHISTQYIWGIRDAVASGLSLPPDKVRVICHFMGGGFGSKNGAGRLHVHRSGAGQAHRAARQVRADAPRGERRRRQPQRDDPAADDRRQARRHADRARRRVRQRGRLGRLVLRHRGADADALRVRERQDDDVRREDQPAADEGVPRARVRRGDVRARGAAGRARGQARRRPARAAPAATTPTTTPPTPVRSAARS